MSWKRRCAVAAVGLLALIAAFAGGAVVGWREALRTDPGRLPETVTVAVGAARVDGASVVPDVRGLARPDALQALADAGVPVVAVDVAEVPSALPVDTVLRQDPPGGSPFGGVVVVDVAVAGVVPDVVGRPLPVVRAELEELGAEVVVDYEYADAAEPGTVLGADPAPGSPLAAQVRLRAVEAPASVYLSELDPVAGGGSSGPTSVDGTEYDQSLQVGGTAEFLLDRGVRRFTAVVGMPDDGRVDATATVVVLADGREVARLTVAYGRAQPVDLALDGVLRLSIEVDGDTVAFADPLLVGRPDVVDQLERR